MDCSRTARSRSSLRFLSKWARSCFLAWSSFMRRSVGDKPWSGSTATAAEGAEAGAGAGEALAVVDALVLASVVVVVVVVCAMIELKARVDRVRVGSSALSSLRSCSSYGAEQSSSSVRKRAALPSAHRPPCPNLPPSPSPSPLPLGSAIKMELALAPTLAQQAPVPTRPNRATQRSVPAFLNKLYR